MDRRARRRPAPRTGAVIEPPAGTYVYCIVAAARRPRVSRRAPGLPGTGPVRVIDVDRGLYLVAADAPLAVFGADALQSGLGDVEWVSHAAVAHEAVIESFAKASAVLPMKLFTIFNSDERAADHLRGERARIDALVRRLAGHDEWGVRVALDRSRPSPQGRRVAAARPQPSSGLAYLKQKQAQRDAVVELAARARHTVAALYERLAAKARAARRRSATEMPDGAGALLLDAAFLVPRGRARTFRSTVAREARALAANGYGVTLTGPWPPYSFVQD